MKPFQLAEGTTVLKFPGTKYAGLEVMVNDDFPIEVMFEIGTVAKKVALQRFAQYGLVSWNLKDKKGHDVPATEEGMMKLPTRLIDPLLLAWVKAVSEVADPLGETSSSGVTSAAG